jgi:hypothetical protein
MVELILQVKVRKLHDGRFRVGYCWYHWYSMTYQTHREYFDTEAEAAAFVSKLVTGTHWED